MTILPQPFPLRARVADIECGKDAARVARKSFDMEAWVFWNEQVIGWVVEEPDFVPQPILERTGVPTKQGWTIDDSFSDRNLAQRTHVNMSIRARFASATEGGSGGAPDWGISPSWPSPNEG